MNEHLSGLALVILLGISAQWLAWRLRLPSILLLLLFGFAAGPLAGIVDPDLRLIDPDKIFGELLFPIVSVSVAIILFEGGLSLRFAELERLGGVVRNLVTVGALVSWGLTAVAARWCIFDSWDLSLLLGAILVVTGPTVIVPLLRHVRPSRRVGSVLRWEGIVIDPIGAVLAVLVFETIQQGEAGTAHAVVAFLTSVAVGLIGGILGAGFFYIMVRRHLLPDFLQNPVSLMVVVGIFAVSNQIQEESGLFSVTVMGIVLANQRSFAVKHILEFKENLRVLLISCLFVLLAARLDLELLRETDAWTVLFVLLLVVVVRPVTVLVSTYRSQLTRRERAFLAAMAPRGIVAAAVASVFAIHLVEGGREEAEKLVTVVFFVIVGTVMLYGLTAVPVARALELARPNPQGVLIVGAHSWARALGKILRDEGFDIVLVDTNWNNLRAARMMEMPIYYGSSLTEIAHEEISLEGLGRLLALTSDDLENSLAALHYAEVFGRTGVFQLSPESADDERMEVPKHLRGSYLFGKGMSFAEIEHRWETGARFKKTKLSAEFDYEAYKKMYGESAVTFFVIDEKQKLQVMTTATTVSPTAGQTIVGLVYGEEDPEGVPVASQSADQSGPELTAGA